MFNDYTEPLEQIIISAKATIEEREKLIKVINGLYKMNCSSCKHRIEDKRFMYDDYCAKGCWGEEDNENVNNSIDFDKMKCNFWEAR